VAGGGGGYLPRLVLLAVLLLIVSMGALYVLYDPPAGLSESEVFGNPIARSAPAREPIRAGEGREAERAALPSIVDERPERPAAPITPQGHPGTPLDRARAAVGRADYGEAARQYARLAPAERTASVRREHARALALGDDPAAAARMLEPLVAERPGDAALRLELARYRWWSGDTSGSLQATREALALAPGDVEATRLLRELRGSLQPTAAEAADWLAERDAPQERLWLGRALAGEGRFGEAVVHMRYAAWSGEFPDSLWLEYAAVAAQADSAAATADALVRYAERSTPDRETRVRTARALAWALRTEESLALYAALLGEGEDPTLRLERARLYAGLERWDDALVDLRAVLATRPRDADALLLAADIERWHGSQEEAVALYERALDERPADERGRAGLALAQAALEPRAPRRPEASVPPIGRWEATNHTFGDNQSFLWYSNTVTRTWFGDTRVWSVGVQSDAVAGRPAKELDLLTAGFALRGQGRFTTSEDSWLTLGVGFHAFDHAGIFPTALAGVTWDARPGTRLEARYEFGSAVRRAATTAALAADALSNLATAAVHTGAGKWRISVATETEFLTSQLGETWRIGASTDIRRPLAGGFSALAGMSFIGTTGDSPALDGEPLYWTPDYYLAPSVGLAWERKIDPDRFVGLRVRPSYVFVRERGPERRFFDEEVFFLGAGLDMNLAGDGWDVLASLDWTGAAFEPGYRGALLRVQWVTRPLWP
jgi:tetratricopeptide (TPR) repeat protein